MYQFHAYNVPIMLIYAVFSAFTFTVLLCCMVLWIRLYCILALQMCTVNVDALPFFETQ